MLYHVTGLYRWRYDIDNARQQCQLDVKLAAPSAAEAIDRAIAATVQVMPDWEDDDQVVACPLTGAALAAYETAQAAQFQAQYSEPLFPLE